MEIAIILAYKFLMLSSLFLDDGTGKLRKKKKGGKGGYLGDDESESKCLAALQSLHY